MSEPAISEGDRLQYFLDQQRTAVLAIIEGLDESQLHTLLGEHGLDWPDEPITDLRWVALHMIEETARHAGHLDVARELLDGATGRGPR